MPHFCHHCKKEVQITDRVGRGDTCPFCNADAHCCLNCTFYDISAYNDCREPNAERVLDKDRANFCDYFEFAQDRKGGLPSKELDAKAKLEALFTKQKQT